MNRTDIIRELNNRGYKATEIETIKNGVTHEGISIREENSNIAPVIYTDNIIKNAISLEDAINTVISIYEDNKNMPFNISEISRPDFIRSNLYVGVQKVSANAPYVHRPTQYEGIEEYLYVRVDNSSIYRLSLVMADKLEMSDNELFEIAYENTFKIVNTMKYYSLTTLSTSFGKLGASAMLCNDKLNEYAREHGTDGVFILPSSIHEVILIPYDESIDINDLNKMIQDVNDCTVDIDDQLGDKAYIYKIA